MLNPNLIARIPKPISCRLLAPLLTRYVEAAKSLSPDERKAVADHLHLCSTCAEETEAIQAMGSLLQESAPSILPITVPSANLWDRIEARIIAEEVPAQPMRSKKALGPALVLAPAFAALIVAAIVVPKTMQHNTLAPEITASHAAQIPGSAPVMARQEAQAHKPALEMATAPKLVAPMAATKLSAPVPSKAVFAGTVVPVFALADKAMPVARANPQSIAKQVRVQKQSVQVAMQPRIRPWAVVSHPSAQAHHQRENTQYTVIEIVPVPSPAPHVMTQIAMNKMARSMAAKSIGENNTQQDVAYTDASAGASTADTHVFAPAAAPSMILPVAPISKVARPLDGISEPSRTIIVVDSNPGPGVPESAKKFPAPSTSVTETLIRSRQRRGLFGGYGAGMTAMMPAGMSPKKNEAGEPW